jgi:hypothetical protein
MRRALVVVIVLLLAGLVLESALDDREVAFNVGLPAVRVAVQLDRGERTCRRGVDVPAGFERVGLVVGTFRRAGPALRVAVADDRSGRLLAGGEVPAGYPDNSSVDAPVGVVAAGARVRVCVENAGPGPVALFGSPPDTPPYDLDDPELQARPAFVFLREPPPSMLSLVPVAFERSALFKFGGAGPWLAWLLLAVVAVAVPLALVRALSAAYASERSSSASSAGAPRASERAS